MKHEILLNFTRFLATLLAKPLGLFQEAMAIFQADGIKFVWMRA